MVFIFFYIIIIFILITISSTFIASKLLLVYIMFQFFQSNHLQSLSELLMFKTAISLRFTEINNKS